MRIILPVLLLSTALRAMPAAGAEDVRIIQSDATGGEYRVTVPEPEYVPVSGAAGYYRAELTGYAAVDDSAGRPQLPGKHIYIGIPWLGDVTVSVRPVISETAAPGRIRPVPTVTGTGLERTVSYGEDTAVYGRNSFYPAVTYRYAIETFREQRTVMIELQPLAYNGAAGKVRAVREYRVTVSHRPATGAIRDDRHFESVYRSMLVNYQQARTWRRPRSVAVRSPLRKSAGVTASGEWYTLRVSSNGIYRISGDDLVNAGLSPVTGAGLRLYTGSGRMIGDGALPAVSVFPRDSLREVAVYVSTEGTFGSDDYLLFYGTGLAGWDYDTAGGTWSYYKNLFTDNNVYWLTVDHSTDGKRMQTFQADPVAGADTVTRIDGRVHFEQEREFDFDEWADHRKRLPADYRDWGWKIINAGAGNWEVMHRDFSLPGFIAGSDAAFTVKIARSGGGAQPVAFRCNGVSLVTGVVSGQSSVVSDGFNASGNLLEAASNRNFFDWFEVRYPRTITAEDGGFAFGHDTTAAVAYRVSGLTTGTYQVFDVTDPFNVRYAERPAAGGTLTLGRDRSGLQRFYGIRSGAWRSAGMPVRNTAEDLLQPAVADYLLIVPAEFAAEAERLAAFHRSRMALNGIVGTRVVKLDDIYDNFSAGRKEPYAIREFLTHAFDTYAVPPAYAVLVGDGHFDFRYIDADRDDNRQRDWMPVYQSSDGTCSDDWFVSRDWGGSAATNRMMSIGRLPVTSADELGTVIDKIIAYETDPAAGIGWRSRVVLIADDEHNPEYPGGEESLIHVTQSEELAAFVPQTYTLKKLYLTDYVKDMQGMKPDATDDFIRIFNKGSLIMNYIGHGAPDILAHESLFRFSSNHESIDNGTRMPLFTAFSCAVGQFDNYDRKSMGEGLMLLEGNGAIASIAATEETGITSNPTVNQPLFGNYFNSDCLSVGQALLATKQSPTASWNTAKVYHLLGDPLLSISRPRFGITIDGISPDSLMALSLTTVTGTLRDTAGVIAAGFAGEVFVEVFDAEQSKTHYNDFDSTKSVTYSQQGGCLFRGSATVSGGHFTFSFVVPKDISYQQAGGKITAYASSALGAGFGARTGIFLGGTATGGTGDDTGPEITLELKNYRVSDYGAVSDSPVLRMTLTDASGINTAGAVGHGITLMLDNDLSSAQDMTGNFMYDRGSHTQGTLEYAMFNLQPGNHVLSVKAWDSFNNSRTATLTFSVVSGEDIRVLNPLNYPNPFVPAPRNGGGGGTTISYTLSRSVDNGTAIRIYTVSGRFVRELTGEGAAGYNTARWDGRDRYDRPLANGTYMYVVMAKTTYQDDLKVKTVVDRATGYAVIMR